MNMYGQPALIVPQDQQGQNNANSTPQGLLPQAANGLCQLAIIYGVTCLLLSGEYKSPYAVPPGSGQVTTSFVPGTR